MLNLIKYDLYKMVKSRKLYFFYAFAFMVAFVSPVARCLYPNGETIIRLLSEETMVFYIIPIFAVVFCVEDFSSGYIKNIFPSLNKVWYVISKALCIFLFYNAYLLISTLVFFMLNWGWVYEFKKTPVFWDSDLYSWVEIIYRSFIVMEYGMAAVMLTFIFRKTRGIPAFLIVFFYQANKYSILEWINRKTGLWNWTGILFPATTMNDITEFVSWRMYEMNVGIEHLGFYLMVPINVAVCVIVFFAMVATIVLSERKV